MAIQHRNIPDAQLHEPKGVANALEGTAYIADGSGSGDWQVPKIEGQESAPSNTVPVSAGGGTGSVVWTDVGSLVGSPTPSVLLRGTSTATSQQPASLDTPIQITFGPALKSSSDPVSLSSDGTLTINETGDYTITFYVQYGRTGGTGTSVLLFRTLIDGVQPGRTIQASIDSSSQVTPYIEKTQLNLISGTQIKYEIMRDSSGDNSGGLFATNPAAEGWRNTSCAFIEVSRK